MVDEGAREGARQGAKEGGDERDGERTGGGIEDETGKDGEKELAKEQEK